MGTRRVVHMYMPNGGEDGVILLWKGHAQNDPRPVKWVEVRGRPYSEWGVDETTPMSRLHDCMPGWHSCVLHQDAVLTLHNNHQDFEDVMSFFVEEPSDELLRRSGYCHGRTFLLHPGPWCGRI
jgi:hypothetical protein